MKISDCIPSFVKTYYSQLQAPIDYKKIFKAAVEYSPTPSLSPRSFKMIVGGLSISVAVIYAIYKFIIGGAPKPKSKDLKSENKKLALEIVSDIKGLKPEIAQVKKAIQFGFAHKDLKTPLEKIWSKTEQLELEPEFKKLLLETRSLGFEIGELTELESAVNLDVKNRKLQSEKNTLTSKNTTLKQKIEDLKSEIKSLKSSNQPPKDNSPQADDQLEKAFYQFLDSIDPNQLPEAHPLLLVFNEWLQTNDNSSQADDQPEKVFNQFLNSIDPNQLPATHPLVLLFDEWVRTNAPLENNDVTTNVFDQPQNTKDNSSQTDDLREKAFNRFLHNLNLDPNQLPDTHPFLLICNEWFETNDNSLQTDDQFEEAFNQFLDSINPSQLPESHPLLLAFNAWFQTNAPLENNDVITNVFDQPQTIDPSHFNYSQDLYPTEQTTTEVDPAAIEPLSQKELKEEMDPHQEAKPLQPPSNNQEAFTEERPREETESQHQ